VFPKVRNAAFMAAIFIVNPADPKDCSSITTAWSLTNKVGRTGDKG